MNGRTKIITIIGVTVFIATITIFALIHPVMLLSTWVGLICVLYGEMVFFSGLSLIEWRTAKSSQIIARGGLGVVIGGYSFVVIISSIIYMSMNLMLVRWFIAFQIFFMVVAIVFTLVLMYVSKGKFERDSKTLQADTMVREFADRLRFVAERAPDKNRIMKLIEDIKYSDTSTMVDADVEIDDFINSLENLIRTEEIDEKSFDDAVKNIEFLIKKRNLQTRSAKQGRI